jgi:hypothetical protein
VGQDSDPDSGRECPGGRPCRGTAKQANAALAGYGIELQDTWQAIRAVEVRVLRASQGTCDLLDHELLERFLSSRDEGTFTFLALSVGALATALAEMAKAAPLPAALTIKTVKAVALVATALPDCLITR